MKKLLVIGYVWPEPKSSAAGSRMMQLIEIFQGMEYQVFYASPAVETEHMLNLDEHGISKVNIELNNSSFDSYIAELSPDVVLFDRFMMEEQFSWRVEEQCPGAIRLLETVDLHCLRDARERAVKAGRDASDLANLDMNSDIAIREVASILRCDLSIMISEYEVDVLQKIYHVNKDLLLYLPFMYEPLDKDSCIQKWPSFTERKNFVTIGNFRHAPNWDSVLFLKQRVWPLIRNKLKDAEIHIYGSYPPKKAQQLQNVKERFYVKGWADNALLTLQQYRLLLAPLRFGAGMKGKLADAMLSGTPGITTPIGAESMQGNENWPGRVCNDAESFSDAAVELYDNENEWKQYQLNGINIVNTLFNRDNNAELFIGKFNELEQNLEQQRNNNFTGMMLRHHTMKSTKYMSQWIEAKNRNK